MTIWIIMGAVCITSLVVLITALCSPNREEEYHGRH